MALSKGKVAPAFTVMDEDGKTYQLSDFRGKYVLMDIWATTCGPCIKAMPGLIETSKQYENYDHIRYHVFCFECRSGGMG